MNSWLEYLAFLHWQNQVLRFEDFKKVFQNQREIPHANRLIEYVSHPKSKNYLRSHKNWWKEAEQMSKECRAGGIKTTWPFHPDYPTPLLKVENPPPLISWKGRACWKDHFLFSVVGSRHPYQDTLLWMDMHLNSFLKKGNKKICVMSGGARGVDQKAHSASLATEKPTICFLPCGINNYYPADLKKWERPILQGGGAFVSVFTPTAEMRKAYFHTRNKVLAGLSDLLLVAQAQFRSGTMVTARYALHAGTTISVLPGSPLYAGYGGSLSLINDGCFMARDYLDLETLYQSLKIRDPDGTKEHDRPSPAKP